MPSYPLTVGYSRQRLGFYTPTYNDDGDTAWALECGDASQDVSGSNQVDYYTRSIGGKRVNITRNALFFNTIGLSPSLEIVTAGLWVYTGHASWGGGAAVVDDWVHVVTCPDIHQPCIEADYGYLGGRNTPVASLFVPVGLPNKRRYLELNAAGIAAINPGGVTPFGVRHGRDIDVTFPGWDVSHGCSFGEFTYDPLLYINQPLIGGFIWVEGTKLAYLDAYRQKRLREGTITGDAGIAGHIWIEEIEDDGKYLHYIDSGGVERKILGVATGLNGKVPGQISINTAQGEAKFCYIDATGAERCFEGT